MRHDHGKIAAGLLGGLMILMLALTGCANENQEVVPRDIAFQAHGILEFNRGDSTLTRIAIEIADTDSSKIRGLMDRRALPARGGMLFTYSDENQRSFWMRSTPLPLDILFLSPDGRIVNIVKRTTPYSDEQILSDGPAQDVLEVRAGFTDRWNIQPGDDVEWRRVDPEEGT